MVSPKIHWQGSETLTLTGDTTSTAIDCRYYDRFAYQLDWSGLTGVTSTIIPQVSNDGSTWADLDNYWDDISFLVDATSGTQMWIFREIPARYVRLKYTANGNSTGSGTLLWEGQRIDL